MPPRFCGVWATGQCPASKRQEEASGPTPASLGTSKALAGGWVAGSRDRRGAAHGCLQRERPGRTSPTLGPARGPSWRPQATTQGATSWVSGNRHRGACAPLGARAFSQLATPAAWQRGWWGSWGVRPRPTPPLDHQDVMEDLPDIRGCSGAQARTMVPGMRRWGRGASGVPIAGQPAPLPGLSPQGVSPRGRPLEPVVTPTIAPSVPDQEKDGQQRWGTARGARPPSLPAQGRLHPGRSGTRSRSRSPRWSAELSLASTRFGAQPWVLSKWACVGKARSRWPQVLPSHLPGSSRVWTGSAPLHLAGPSPWPSACPPELEVCMQQTLRVTGEGVQAQPQYLTLSPLPREGRRRPASFPTPFLGYLMEFQEGWGAQLPGF